MSRMNEKTNKIKLLSYRNFKLKEEKFREA